MRRFISILLFCITFGAGIACGQVNKTRDAGTNSGRKAVANKRPNVIIILSDDQGYGDFSCHGNPILQTPALDKLHDESVRFSNFHVAPQCTPTRGELLSGLDALHNKAESVGAGRGIMRRDIITMPEVFRENGYHTGIFGKWHLGEGYPDRPMDRGFEKCIWFRGWGLLSEMEYDNDYYRTRYLDSLNPVQSDRYCTNLWFDKAMEWMGDMAARQEPFFTYLSLNVTHGPFHSPKKDFEFYRDKVSDHPTASFFGMIRNMDRNVNRLDKWLEEKGLKENTIVIFMNDNGGTGGIKVYNAGMRGKKESNYDGGHRAACFIRWPDGGIGSPRTIPDATQVQDLLPSFIDLLDLKLKGKHRFDGESLRPVLKQQGVLKDRMFVVQYGGNKQPDKYFSCVVWNSWRLVGKNELYDINRDTGQENNIAAAHPEVFNKMSAFYENWWAETEPETKRHVSVFIGYDLNNPVILSSNDWVNGYVNTQWAVAQGSGNATGGAWNIQAEKSGEYRLELSRWPFHLNRDMNIAGPETAVGGTKLRTGKALQIGAGCVMVNNQKPTVVKSIPGATNIAINVHIEAGHSTMQAWFKDADGADLCGAYYVRVTRLK